MQRDLMLHRLLPVSIVLLIGLALLDLPTASAKGSASILGWSIGASSILSAPSMVTRTIYFPFIGVNRQPAIPLWRFGVARARRPVTDYNYDDLRSMRFGWYVDWSSSSDSIPWLGIEYLPIIRVRQVKIDGGGQPTNYPCLDCPYAEPYTYTVSITPAQIQSMAASRPGRTWVIGNEIERLDWGTGAGEGQDEILPELYAVAYHDLYYEIKDADPTAQVAIAGMIQATPLRLKYLQRIWDRYDLLYGEGLTNTMPVDVWNIHAFVLNEQRGGWGADIPAGLTDTSGLVISPEQNKQFSIAQGHITALRTWMAQHGQRNKPLIITEYGVNYPPDWCYSNGVCPFTYEAVRDSFMYPSFNFFLNTTSATIGFPQDGNRLVQRWNWWSLDDDRGTFGDGTFYLNYNGNLFYSGLSPWPQGVSALGTYWKQYVQSLPSGATKPY